MDALKVTLVGAGILGRRYARVLAENPDTTLAAVVNRTAERARALADTCDVAAFDDLDAALDTVDSDAVVVATADHAHRDPVLTAVRHGLDVMVEKPLATSLSDAREMADAAARAERVMKVNHSQRGVEDYRWIRDRIAAGAIGTPRLVQHVRHDRIDVPTDMIAGWAARTSPLLFISSHDIDLVQWFLGRRAVRVAAQEHRGVLRDRGIDTPDAIDALITWDDGATATFHVSWIHPASHPVLATDRFMIVGDEGSIAYRGRGRHVELHGPHGEEAVTFTGIHTADEVDGRLAGAFVDSVADFVRCVRERREPDTSARRMLPLAATQAAVLTAIEERRVVEIEPAG